MRAILLSEDKPPPAVPSGSVRWTISDAAGWFVVAQIGSAFWVVAVLAVMHGSDRPDPLPITTLVVGQLFLWFAYGAGPLLTSWRKGNGALDDFGLRVKPIDVVVGPIVGVLTQLAVLPVLYLPLSWFSDADPGEAARELIDRIDGSVDRVLIVLLVVVVAPLVEEIFYRGFLLRAIEMRLGSWPAILISAAVFAVAHFQLLQLPGLFVFGVIAGWLAVRTGRLGTSWAMHVAFNATTLVVLLNDW